MIHSGYVLVYLMSLSQGTHPGAGVSCDLFFSLSLTHTHTLSPPSLYIIEATSALWPRTCRSSRAQRGRYGCCLDRTTHSPTKTLPRVVRLSRSGTRCLRHITSPRRHGRSLVTRCLFVHVTHGPPTLSRFRGRSPVRQGDGRCRAVRYDDRAVRRRSSVSETFAHGESTGESAVY